MITIAADLGGTAIKLGVVSDGKLAAQSTLPADSSHGLSPRLPALAGEIERLLDSLGLKPGDCHALGLAFPGLVEPDQAKVRATYAKWDDAGGLDLPAWAKDRFGLPLVMENDTRLALLGEWRAGAGYGLDNLVLVTLGTGLGTSAVIEGKLLKGVHGQAGVLGGHFAVDRDGAGCSCGNMGCAEAAASTSVLPRIARARADFAASPLSRRATIDYGAVFEAARAGDPCALALKESAIQVWAQMIVNLIHAYDPERVIVGGGIMAGAADFFDAMTAKIHAHAHTPWGKVEIVPGALGSAAALIGLDALARAQLRVPV
jgi:glucokinase